MTLIYEAGVLVAHRFEAQPEPAPTGNWPYDIPDVGINSEPANNSPRGLLMVAPITGRIGWTS